VRVTNSRKSAPPEGDDHVHTCALSVQSVTLVRRGVSPRKRPRHLEADARVLVCRRCHDGRRLRSTSVTVSPAHPERHPPR
jgi:hypothetical protein